MTSSIKPTIGRKVWFWLGIYNTSEVTILSASQALDATVVFVNSDDTINIMFLDHLGLGNIARDVPLADPNPEDAHGFDGAGYATWMPYQVGQAKKEGV